MPCFAVDGDQGKRTDSEVRLAAVSTRFDPSFGVVPRLDS